MKFQKVIRIVCLLLAVLVLVGTVLRPLDVQAAAIAATAGVVGIAVETAIPWIFSALSVAYLYSCATSLYTDVKSALAETTTTISGTNALKAYSYNGSYCLDSATVEIAADVIADYVSDTYAKACDLGLQFSTAYTIYLENCSSTISNGKQAVVHYWGDIDPTYNQNGDTLVITFHKRGIHLRDNGLVRDFSDSKNEGLYITGSYAPYKYVSCVKQSPKEISPPDISENAKTLASTGIWIVDTTPDGDPTDGGKKRILPVIATSSIDSTTEIVETDDIVEVDTTTSTDTPTSTGNLIDFLSDFWTGFKTKMLEIPDILTQIRDFVKSIPETLINIWEWVKTVPQILVDALVSVFVPAEGYLDTKVDELLSTYEFLYGFASDAKFLRNQLRDLGTTPPVIYIPLGSSETSYSIGSDTIFLDLSWYAKYKPTVDAILSAFLWILFIWKLFLKLPGIVSGLPGDFVMGGLNDFGLADHLPSRKASYEMQRQSNREYIRKGGK